MDVPKQIEILRGMEFAVTFRVHSTQSAHCEVRIRGNPKLEELCRIDWLLPEGAGTVLDLGAGTGKLTRALAARRLEVVAVEPLAEMRTNLAWAAPINASLAVAIVFILLWLGLMWILYRRQIIIKI